MKSQFYFGCVECRDDPLRLGRYQVRVLGIHTEDISKLPTSDLPWATCLQPTTSAASSGIGLNPGLVAGSWVMVVFTSDDNQFPIIIGSIAGIPGENNFSSSGRSAPTPLEATPSEKEAGIAIGVYDPSILGNNQPYIGSLTETQYKQYTAKVRQIESSGIYTQNSTNYLGAYQFGAAALEDSGYIKPGSWGKLRSNTLVNDPINWTGKDGCNNKENFLAKPEVQDKCMLLYTQRAYKAMVSKGQAGTNTDPRVLAGLLGAAHNQGPGVISKLLRGETTRDGLGTTAQSYYNRCYSAITIISTQETNTTPSSDQTVDRPVPTEEKILIGKDDTVKSGFHDPEGKYPKVLDEADTNRIVRNQKIESSIVDQKEKSREKNVVIGLSDKSWDQPSVQYAAQYPFNHAYVSESGHVMEFDDTNKAERIQLYHRTGTFTEIDQAGNQVNKVVGHNVEIIEKDGYITIKGNGHLNITGSFTLNTENAHLEIKNLNIKTEKVIWDTHSFYLKASDTIAMDASKIVFSSSGLFKAAASGNIELSTGSQYSVNSGGISSIDGSSVYLNSNKSANSAMPNRPPIVKYTGDIMDISAVSRSDNEASSLDDNPHVEIIKAEEIAAAPPPVIVRDSTMTTSAPIATDTNDCELFDLTHGMNIKLSENYTLKDLCKDGGFNFAGQHGLSVQTILCNLSKVCSNILEPLRQTYGNSIKINSGFRPAGSPVSASRGISQHEKGEAVDIGFLDIARGTGRKEAYFKRAEKIQGMLPYDQMLLESLSANDSVWIHLSYSRTKQRKQVMTFVNHKVANASKLVLYN